MKTSGSTDSSTQPGKGRVEVDSNSRAEYDRNEVDRSKVDDGEVENDKVWKKG